MNNLDWKKLFDITQAPQEPVRLFPMCCYDAMTEEQRINYYRDACCDVYFLDKAYTKSQTLYKLTKEGKLEKVE